MSSQSTKKKNRSTSELKKCLNNSEILWQRKVFIWIISFLLLILVPRLSSCAHLFISYFAFLPTIVHLAIVCIYVVFLKYTHFIITQCQSRKESCTKKLRERQKKHTHPHFTSPALQMGAARAFSIYSIFFCQ